MNKAHSSTNSIALPPFADRHIAADNCFTFLRYAFALCIFCNHLCYTRGEPIFLIYGAVFIQGFFIISGFLTMNSYVARDDWRDFCFRRIRRLLPGYFTAVLLCFGVGIIFTTLPLRNFFTSIETWKYLLANLLMMNFWQPSLPGVFDDHAFQALNSSLWTMKIEVAFYITVPLVTWLMKRWKPIPVLAMLVGLSWLWFTSTHYLYILTEKEIFYQLNHQIMGELQFFYLPILFLFCREWFQRHERLLVLSAIIFLALSYSWCPFLSLMNAYTLSVLMISIAYRLEPWIRARRWKDVSYEFFLLRFPLLQVVVELMPGASLALTAAVSLPLLILASLLLNKWCKSVVRWLSLENRNR